VLQTSLFVQLHGIASTTCTVDAFISHGGGGTSVYGEAGNGASALAAALPLAITAAGLSPITAATPATNNCAKKGSDNIFGRRVNGVAWQASVARAGGLPAAFLLCE
jgi:phage tail sheath gpL-like